MTPLPLPNTTDVRNVVVGLALVCVLSPLLSPDRAEELGAATPEDLVRKLAEAYENGDPAAAKALVDQSTTMGQLMANIQGKMVLAAAAYRELMESAKQKFGAEDTAELAGKFLPDGTSDFSAIAEDLKVKIKGDKATVRRPGKKKLTLTRKESRWFLDAEAIMGKKMTEQLEGGSPEEREQTFWQTEKLMSTMVDVFRDKSVVDECSSVQELQEKLDKRLTGAILKAMGEIIAE